MTCALRPVPYDLRPTTYDQRFGFTLVELLVVLLILGLITGISGLALASLHPPEESAWVRALHRARAEAVRSGEAVMIELESDSGPPTTVRFLPDGRALGAGVNPLTGEPMPEHANVTP